MVETIVTSSILILCIMLIRKLCKGHISARLQYALWLIVAARLIMPAAVLIFPNILPQSDLNIISMADRVVEAAQPEAQQDNAIAPNGLPILAGDSDSSINANSVVSDIIYVVSNAISSHAVFFRMVWYVGIAAAGVWAAAVNINFAHRLRRERIRYEKEGFELTKPIPVYLVKSLSSPCLYGIFGNQAIYLSEAAIEDDEKLKHVIAHEYCHYRNKDIFWSALRCILLAVYWFNPLVWIAAAMSKQDCELACDEAAIKLLGEEERVAYGKTLVSLITRKTKASDIACAATTMTGGAKDIKERVSRIATKPRKLMLVMLPVLVVVCAAAVLTFTQAKEQSEKRYLLEEGSMTVTTDCFQVTFPDYFAGKSYYRGENNTDIIVYHTDSDREIGRFCMLPYEDAVKLAEEKIVITLGNYGSNDTLASRARAKKMLPNGRIIITDGSAVEVYHEYHEYTPEEEPNYEEKSTTYIPDETDSSIGVPGIDINDDETTYTASDSLSGMQPIPAPEAVETELINLPYEEIENKGGAVGTDSNASVHTYTPAEAGVDSAANEEIINETLPDEQVEYEEDETEYVYLPQETITTYAIAGEPKPCYLYVPADNSDAEQQIQAELTNMNNILEGILADVRVLSVSAKTIQESLDTMLKNRTSYVGDNVRTTQIAGAIPTTDALSYQYLAIDSNSEPYGVTLYYNLNGSYGAEEADMRFMGAALMFASIENLSLCDIVITDVNNPNIAESSMVYHYSRAEMEELFGELFPCSENKEDFTDLYNRIVEYLEQ
ncbi:MAG: DUF4825 domain-containing protein [Clostridiales bacterium]|nr:DUF4825 domain-containing protein [Clostridiales bacterium]